LGHAGGGEVPEPASQHLRGAALRYIMQGEQQGCCER
jgi:hypothetical protein